MRVLAVLWTVWLVRLCYGGDENKVDSSLFNVEEAEEDTVKVLKLTPKDGQAVTHVTYDEKQIWSGKVRIGKSSNLVEALIYFYREIPALAIISTDKNSKVYRYHDGKQWHDSKEDDYKNKLTTLKKKCKPTTPITLDLSNPDNSKIKTTRREDNGASIKFYTPKDAFHISSVVGNGGVELWKANKAGEKCTLVQCCGKEGSMLTLLQVDSDSGLGLNYFEKVGGPEKAIIQEASSSSVKFSRENPRSTPPQQPVESPPQPTEPKEEDATEVPQDGINLDLAKPDETTSRLAPRNGLVLSPHGAFRITSVMDGNQVLWEAKEDNEKYVTINLYSKGDASLLLGIEINDSHTTQSKRFEKADGEWSEVALNDFLEKLYEMRNSTSQSPSEDSPNPTSKSTIHSQ